MRDINLISIVSGQRSKCARDSVNAESIALHNEWLNGALNARQAIPVKPETMAHISARAVELRDDNLELSIYCPKLFIAGQARPRANDPMIAKILISGNAQTDATTRHFEMMADEYNKFAKSAKPQEPWAALAMPAPATGEMREWLCAFQKEIAWAWVARRPIEPIVTDEEIIQNPAVHGFRFAGFCVRMNSRGAFFQKNVSSIGGSGEMMIRQLCTSALSKAYITQDKHQAEFLAKRFARDAHTLELWRSTTRELLLSVDADGRKMLVSN